MSTIQESERRLRYMNMALDLARKSPPRATNYCIGAVLVNEHTDQVCSTGYTLELPGNTHAEECCLEKYAQSNRQSQSLIAESTPVDEGESIEPPLNNFSLYCTMEPCSRRTSGNEPCVNRIIKTHSHGWPDYLPIRNVYIGISEPSKFIAHNSSQSILRQAGINMHQIPGLEKEILAVATAGHDNPKEHKS